MYIIRSEFDLETIVRRIDGHELDLQPDFQRGEIWDKKRRQRLIDTLLREWYVPAVHIVRGAGKFTETVLDGQQRLAAIRDFFHDEFPVDGSTTPRTNFIESLHGLRYSQLPSDVRQTLQRFTLPCVTLRDFEPDEPNELFFRLNQSYNLTPSEKRNALHGEARDQVRTVVSELARAGLLSAPVVGFSNNRLAYDDIVARSCLAVEQGSLRQHINNTVVEDFYRTAAFSSRTIDGIVKSGEKMLEMLERSKDRLRFNKATLFTWLVFCYWVPTSTGAPVPDPLLAEFESDRLALKRSETPPNLSRELANVVSIYDDRASYRVTDVSSVLARDCALYLYMEANFKVPSFCDSDSILHSLLGRSETDAQQLLIEFVTRGSQWGIFGSESTR